MSSVDSIQIILFYEEQKRVVEGKNDARCHRELARRLVPIRNDVRYSRKINSHILIIVKKRCKSDPSGANQHFLKWPTSKPL